MNEWTLAMGGLAVIFFVIACALGHKCIELYDDIKYLEDRNADLRYSVKCLNSENERLKNSLVITPDTQDVTRMKLELHLKQERIEALQMKVKRQHQLLQQKWGDSKCR